ncbi:hypothetical protein ACFQZE_04030 [Paenibacillus sp. GCM10027627]
MVGLLCCLLVAGCSHLADKPKPSETVSASATPIASTPLPLLPALPQEISLSFVPIELSQLPERVPASHWKLEQTLNFGYIGDHAATLYLYVSTPEFDGTTSRVQGILEAGNKSYDIPEVSESAIDPFFNGYEEISVIQQSIAGMDRYLLLGRVAKWANSPGLYRYILYDNERNQFLYFDSWGAMVVEDLDKDGLEEMVLVFEGAHQSQPDIFFLRANKGGLELSEALLDKIRRNQGDRVTLAARDGKTVVRISNVEFESLYDDYLYDKGALKRVPNIKRH